MCQTYERQQQLRYLLGYVAAALCCYAIISKISSLKIVIAALFFLVACIFDTHKQRIPNYLVLALILTALSTNTINTGWAGLIFGLKGFFVGLVFLLPFYMLGGFGAGDVKALAALGALIGPTDVLHSIIYIGLYGGVIAVLYMSVNAFFKPRGKQTIGTKSMLETSSAQEKAAPDIRKFRFPFAPAMAFGYYTFVTYGPFLKLNLHFLK